MRKGKGLREPAAPSIDFEPVERVQTPGGALQHRIHRGGRAMRHTLDGYSVNHKEELMGEKESSYLAERDTMLETRKFFRSSYFAGKTYEEWETKGKKDELTLAKEKADWILKNHEPVMLDRDISKRLDQIVKEASKTSAP